MSDIKLVVQGDDLGMCRSVNEGIVLAATEGILTQASVMAPTPWFAEGAAMVQRVGLPVGLHVTLTCEWDYLRWSPLSPAPSLRAHPTAPSIEPWTRPQAPISQKPWPKPTRRPTERLRSAWTSPTSTPTWASRCVPRTKRCVRASV